MLANLAKVVRPSFGRQLAAMSTAARPAPIENPDIKYTGVRTTSKVLDLFIRKTKTQIRLAVWFAEQIKCNPTVE